MIANMLRPYLQKATDLAFRVAQKNTIPALGMTSSRTFMKHQNNLPHLPVPPLDKTLQKYLKTIKPLVSEEEFKVTEQIVTKFGSEDGIGMKLQQLLENRAKKLKNWLTDWWVQTAYFDFRWPVVVWSSPGLVFPSQKFKSLDDQLHFAALTICGSLDFKSLIDRGTVTIDKMGKELLDMSQYYKIFGTYRIPGITRDSIKFYCQEYPHPNHVVIAHNNHFFKLDVYDENENPLSVGVVKEHLRHIVERSTHPAAPVGILTTQNRNVWGKTFRHLMKDKQNRHSITEIQKSLFLVCLDGPISQPSGDKLTDAALECLHGNGPNGNAGNRWYDKTLQFVIGKKGESGLTYEHSPAEGPPISNLMDHIFTFVKNYEKETITVPHNLSRPERLTFNASDSSSEIALAQQALQSLVDDLDMACFNFDTYGKKFIKEHNLSPDSYIQMAIQLAFYRIHKEPGAQYESASTRKYADGRTETIRSCSEESVDFAQKMLNAKLSDFEKEVALREAVDVHKAYVMDSVNGFGVDRHLLGLKLTAIEAGMNVPSIFMDVSYIRSSHMRLSTSNVPAKIDAFMCYGPLVPDGYGCCYNPRSNGMIFGISALNSSPETNAKVFKQALQESLLDMKGVLERTILKSKL